MNEKIIAIAIISAIVAAAIYIAYWAVESEDCLNTHSLYYPRSPPRDGGYEADLSDYYYEPANKPYFHCLESKWLPVFEKPIFPEVDFVQD